MFRSDDNGTVQSLVAAGLGNGLIPRLAADPADPRTRILAVDGLAPRRLGIVRHRDRHVTPATRAYVELAREHLRHARLTRQRISLMVTRNTSSSGVGSMPKVAVVRDESSTNGRSNW